jgi:type I restriction enzyme M protein
MPSKRDVLGHLTRDELVAAADAFELTVGDRRVRDQLVDAVASSKKAGLADVLAPLSRDRLKELCRALGLDDTGKEKTVLVDRLTGASAKASPPAAKTNGVPRSAIASNATSGRRRTSCADPSTLPTTRTSSLGSFS